MCIYVRMCVCVFVQGCVGVCMGVYGCVGVRVGGRGRVRYVCMYYNCSRLGCYIFKRIEHKLVLTEAKFCVKKIQVKPIIDVAM